MPPDPFADVPDFQPAGTAVLDDPFADVPDFGSQQADPFAGLPGSTRCVAKLKTKTRNRINTWAFVPFAICVLAVVWLGNSGLPDKVADMVWLVADCVMVLSGVVILLTSPWFNDFVPNDESGEQP